MTDTFQRLTAALADRYRIIREVGAGGMATVYLAEDLRHGRQVALKVLRPELAATLGSERFFREIRVAARLQHGLAGFDRSLDYAGDVNQAALQTDLPARDAREVEEVVDDPHQLAHLPP